jgi:hypothetical protein
MSTWCDKTNDDCVLCQHLHRDDNVCLGLIARYCETDRRTLGGAAATVISFASVRARATRWRATRSSALEREVGS